MDQGPSAQRNRIMGVDHNAYIGPYLRVTETVTEQKQDKCADHDFPADASFCPKCGTKKNDRIRTFEASNVPDGWEEDYKKGDFHDYLVHTSFMSSPDIEEKDSKRTRTYLYMPNRYYDELKIPRVDGGKYSEEEVPFDDLDVPGITIKFLELFADEIEYLRQWFEVEVKFGYIGYCS